MPEQEDRLEKFYLVVEKKIACLLEEFETKINRAIKTGNVSMATDLLIDANNTISLACGEDEELYDLWRYRLFLDNETGKMTIIQGDEIEVDFRGWSEYFPPDSGGDDYDDEDYYD